MSAAEFLDTDERLPWTRLAGGWLFSLVLHFVIAISGALMFVASGIVPTGDEPTREVGVVLVQNTDANKVQYFDETESRALSGQEDGSTDPVEGGGVVGLPDALPSKMPNVALPALPETTGVAGPNNLVGVPKFQAGNNSAVVILPGQGDADIIAAELAAQARIPPKGPTAELALFGSGTAVGNSFVFVIDRSKSMGGDGLGAIEAAAKEFERTLGALTAEQRFQVVAYNEQTLFLDGRRLIEASEQNRIRLIKFVGDLAAFGPTEHEIALASALSMRPDVLFLFSDGGDPELNSSQVARIINMASGKTTIHCIQFGMHEEPKEGFMKTFAKATRGSYAYVRVK